MTDRKKPAVFFDGACPLCRREIDFYRRRDGADVIAWIDVSDDNVGRLPAGLSVEAARGRFHVITPSGELVSGGRAFAELWAVLPAFSWAGQLLRHRPFVWLLNGAYEIFLPLRPHLQRLAGGNPA